MRWFKLLTVVILVCTSPSGAVAATAKIIKVLPHRLDRDGRHTLSPSLYDRDAYQAFLRKNPNQNSGLRFDVQWKAKRTAGTEFRLRVEIRGSRGASPILLEQTAHPDRWYRSWSSLRVDGEAYKKLGEMIAWRATLWEGDRLAAEQKSFLW
jgi:hypothetical protein